MSLAMLMGRQSSQAFDVDSVVGIPDVPPIEELLRSLRQRNPEVLSADAAIEASSHHVRSVRSTLFPRIDVTGGYQITSNRNDAGFLLENRSNGWVTGVTFRYDLFRGNADAQAIERAGVERLRRQLERDELVADLSNRLLQVHARYQQGRQLLALERTSMEAAERNARIAMDRLRAGTLASIDARQSLLTVLDVAQRLTQTEYETHIAAIEALRLAGLVLR
jgi:outer membrane protein TolC